MGLNKHHLLALCFSIIHFSFFVLLSLVAGNFNFLWGAILLPFYFFLPFTFQKLEVKELLTNILFFSLGFYATQGMQQLFPAVISAAAVGTAFCFLPEEKPYPFKIFQPVFYAGCFAGMSSYAWFPHYSLTIVSCLIGGVAMSVLKHSVQGFGGKLGTIGFASVIIWIFFQTW